MLQSPNDPKDYRALTLSNGLRVLLSQNQQSEKAAAALAVNVGHFDDPQERQGLAHFLEHMLFLGTEKYPDGSEYQKFISQYAGSHNAWTATEHTCFFFDIHHQFFAEALDRFSQFFIAPLLSQRFVENESQNVDAEFKLKLKDDIRRLYDVHKETVNPLHPFSQFSVGNLTTLADSPEHSVRDEVAAFFNEHYRAGYMTLAIEGPQSLNQLQQFAEQYFNAIPAAQRPKAKLTQPLYLAAHLALKILVQPIKQEHKLIVSFTLPSIDHYYRHKPEAILSYLLGHEGPGSLLSELKKRQWVMALSAGSGINGSNFKDFNISFSLTELGEQFIDDIVGLLFSYLKLLKAEPLPEFYYEEKQALAALSFHYQEPLSPLDSVCQAVLNMQHYPEQDYIFGDYVMDGMCHSSIKQLLTYFSPAYLRLVHISQNNQFTQQSQWYNVAYQQCPIPDSSLADWHNVAIQPTLKLPDKNPYIVADPIVYLPQQQEQNPQRIIQQDGLNIWFKQDCTFNTPKGYIYIGIDSPTAIESHANIAMTRLFVELFTDSVVEQNYDAELAGIHYHLYAHQGGITLQLSGLSQNQDRLLQQLLAQLHTVRFSEQRFNLFKQQLIKQWQNSDRNKSISQLFSVLSSAMQPNNPSSDALSKALTQVSYQQFQTFSVELFEQITLDVLIHGNWQHSHAEALVSIIQHVFKGRHNSQFNVDCPVVDTSKLGELVMPITLADYDHASILYYPLASRDLNLVAKTMLTSQLLSPLFFQQMRTEQQLGYLVGVGYVPINRFPGIALYIQSPNTVATNITSAMDLFIQRVQQQLQTMAQEEWQHLQQGLAGQLQEKDTNLGIKSQRFWLSICNKDHEFDHKERLIDAILACDLAEIMSFIAEHLDNSATPDRINLISIKNTEELLNNDQLTAKIKSIAYFSTLSVKKP